MQVLDSTPVASSSLSGHGGALRQCCGVVERLEGGTLGVLWGVAVPESAALALVAEHRFSRRGLARDGRRGRAAFPPPRA